MTVTLSPRTLIAEGLSITSASSGVRVPLVAEVSLDVAPGEVLGILGESGAGKTLTARSWLGLLPRGIEASGRLVIQGTELDLARPDDFARVRGSTINIVFQNPIAAMDPLQRIGRQVVEGVVRKRLMSPDDALSKAHDLFLEMGFAEPRRVFGLYPHQVSGGMAQRIAIATALMSDPALVVADEPTSALDANLKTEILTLLRRAAAERGTSIVLVSHELGLVGEFCDRIAVMYAGRLIEIGPAKMVIADPQHPYTASLLACAPSMNAAPGTRLRAIPGTPMRDARLEGACPFAPRCPVAFSRCSQVQPPLRSAADRSAACLRSFAEE